MTGTGWRCCGRGSSGLTRLVDRLVDLGYVTRCASEQDGRGLYAELTDTGAAKLADARRTNLDGVRRFFLQRLTLSDQAVLGDIWQRMQAAPPDEGEHLTLTT